MCGTGETKIVVAWEGIYLFKLDHKSGYLHVPFHRDSWTFLGVEWAGEVLVFTALAFGGSNCPVIYDFAGGTPIKDMKKDSSNVS